MIGNPAARYASINADTLCSKRWLLRRAQRGPTLNESCASMTSSADWVSGTSLVVSIGDLRVNRCPEGARFGRPPEATCRDEYRSDPATCRESGIGNREPGTGNREQGTG